MSCKVSVVIPCYNAVQTIVRCLDSVLAQTYENFEIIVVNSNSDDGTEIILQEYISKDEKGRIRVFNLPYKQGAAANRNFGISNARGEFIAFLDADDYWFNDKLEYQINLMEEKNIDLFGGQVTSKENDVSLLNKISKIDIRKQLLKNRFLTSTVVYRKNIGLTFRTDFKLSEDNFAWCQTIVNGGSAFVTKKTLGYYELPLDSSHLSSNLKEGHFWEKKVARELYIQHEIGLFFYIFLKFFYKIKYIKRKITTGMRKRKYEKKSN